MTFDCYGQIDNIKECRLELFDSIRHRNVPINTFCKSDSLVNSKDTKIPIAIINHGYGAKNTDYSFIVNSLVRLGYFVICIQHDLPKDEPLVRTGNIYELRKPVWERGVDNINFVISDLKKVNKHLDYRNLVLIGHSNGGDIAMLYSTKYSNLIAKVISLDNLRMPIPRLKHPKILSLRANDTQADKGVIPSDNEQKDFDIKIVYLKNGKHDDLTDYGNDDIKRNIIIEIEKFLNN